MTEPVATRGPASEETEGLDEYADEVLSAPAAWPTRTAVSASQLQSEFGKGVRAELDFAINMRELGQKYLEIHPLVKPQALLWRLMAAVALATSVAAIGLAFSIIALTGQPFAPNPYIALAILLVGCSLCATVASAVRRVPFRLPRR